MTIDYLPLIAAECDSAARAARSRHVNSILMLKSCLLSVPHHPENKNINKTILRRLY